MATLITGQSQLLTLQPSDKYTVTVGANTEAYIDLGAGTDGSGYDSVRLTSEGTNKYTIGEYGRVAKVTIRCVVGSVEYTSEKKSELIGRVNINWLYKISGLAARNLGLQNECSGQKQLHKRAGITAANYAAGGGWVFTAGVANAFWRSPAQVFGFPKEGNVWVFANKFKVTTAPTANRHFYGALFSSGSGFALGIKSTGELFFQLRTGSNAAIDQPTIAANVADGVWHTLIVAVDIATGDAVFLLDNLAPVVAHMPSAQVQQILNTVTQTTERLWIGNAGIGSTTSWAHEGKDILIGAYSGSIADIDLGEMQYKFTVSSNLEGF